MSITDQEPSLLFWIRFDTAFANVSCTVRVRSGRPTLIREAVDVRRIRIRHGQMAVSAVQTQFLDPTLGRVLEPEVERLDFLRVDGEGMQIAVRIAQDQPGIGSERQTTQRRVRLADFLNTGCNIPQSDGNGLLTVGYQPGKRLPIGAYRDRTSLERRLLKQDLAYPPALGP